MADIEKKPFVAFAGFLPRIILVWCIFNSTASFSFQPAFAADYDRIAQNRVCAAMNRVFTDSVLLNPDYRMLRGIFAAQPVARNRVFTDSVLHSNYDYRMLRGIFAAQPVARNRVLTDSVLHSNPDYRMLRGIFAAQSVARNRVLTDSVLHSNPDYRMLRGIFAAQSALYLGTLYGLSKSWYKNPLTKFSFKDDTHEWLQMDKLGHVYTSYQIARHTAAIYKKTEISKKQMLIYGAVSGVIFQTPIEILDGFSPDYGFSPGDMVANITGSAIYLGQIALWDEVRIQPKFSFHYTSLSRVRPELLGSSRLESWLKDYNGQTYWLSFSPGSFFKGSNWPLWLCVSAGYGMQNMVSAERSRSIEMGYVPYRQYYLSLDIDLTKIKSRRKFVRTIGFLVNSIKIPAPALQFSKKGVAFKPFYF